MKMRVLMPSNVLKPITRTCFVTKRRVEVTKKRVEVTKRRLIVIVVR